MKNILVVEDNALHFNIICDALNKELGQWFSVLPRNTKVVEKNLYDFNYLVSAMQERNFASVCEFYHNIDLFIIDATMTPRSDKIGIDFLNFLEKNRKGNFDVIVISNTDEMVNYINNQRVSFISKMKHGIDNFFTIELVSKIKEIYNLAPPEVISHRTIRSLFIQYIKQHGWRYALHKVWVHCCNNINRLMDNLISLLFYLLILVSVSFAGYRIVADYIKLIKDDNLLKIAESIFLNLLPIFIVIGFYNYYRANGRIALLDGNTANIDHSQSTRAMNLTKLLFISSIISYIVISIVDELFVSKTDNIIRLISFGILLALLMIYFIILDGKNHEEKKKL